MERTRCPQCRSLAALENRTAVPRADRRVTYATVRCVGGHWLSCPEDDLPIPGTLSLNGMMAS